MPVRQFAADEVLKEIAQLFEQDATDRQVFVVLGTYARLRPFQNRLATLVKQGDLDKRGKVTYLSLDREVLQGLMKAGKYEEAERLADRGRVDELRRMLSQEFRNQVTSRIEAPGASGLVLADFELLYAYDLGGNDIVLARQVAINGRRVCLLVPGAMRDGRLWIFDEDPQARREFPDALVFRDSGWVFELT